MQLFFAVHEVQRDVACALELAVQCVMQVQASIACMLCGDNGCGCWSLCFGSALVHVRATAVLYLCVHGARRAPYKRGGVVIPERAVIGALEAHAVSADESS
jgi:hypothetical protein